MKTTPLRQKLIDELDLRGFAPSSKDNYVNAVRRLAEHFKRSPEHISDDELKTYLLHLIREQHRARSTIQVIVSALRFFYQHVLGRSLHAVEASLPRMKGATQRPQVYSAQEIERMLSVTDLNFKHRVLLMTIYAGGLRVSEVVRLRVQDLCSDRMQIRIEQSKGNKDRYTVLSSRLLTELRTYWKMYRPESWLFPSEGKGTPLTSRTAQRIFDRAVALAGLPDRGGVHSLRHSFATHALEAGVPLPVLQRLLGHRSLSSTSIYLHVSREACQAVCSPFDLIDPQQLQQAPPSTPAD